VLEKRDDSKESPAFSQEKRVRLSKRKGKKEAGAGLNQASPVTSGDRRLNCGKKRKGETRTERGGSKSRGGTKIVNLINPHHPILEG